MKFKLLKDQSITIFGRKLFKIKALISFGNIKAGENGGYVESEKNLNQLGAAWVYGAARVYGDARVYGAARVSGDARVYGAAWVYGAARVSGAARVYGAAKIIKIVINLIGVCAVSITAYSGYLQIGCELRTFVEWHKILKSDLFKNEMKSYEYQACIEAGLFCEKVIKREILFRQF